MIKLFGILQYIWNIGILNIDFWIIIVSYQANIYKISAQTDTFTKFKNDETTVNRNQAMGHFCLHPLNL